MLLGSALLAGVLVAPMASARGDAPGDASGERYVVRSGDTLWTIATELAPGRDPRLVVDALVQANHVDPGALVPGQALVVPSVG